MKRYKIDVRVKRRSADVLRLDTRIHAIVLYTMLTRYAGDVDWVFARFATRALLTFGGTTHMNFPTRWALFVSSMWTVATLVAMSRRGEGGSGGSVRWVITRCVNGKATRSGAKLAQNRAC